MHSQNEDDNYHIIAQSFGVAKNINQSGKMTVWIMAGNIDNLYQTHHSLGDTKFAHLDSTNDTPEMIVRRVLEWLDLCCNKFTR